MKKAQEELTFVFSLILLALLLTLFFIVVNVASTSRIEQKIDALATNEVNLNMLNYLRTIDKKTNQGTIDLIVYSYHNDDYEDLKRVTQGFFDKYHDKQKCQVMQISLFRTSDEELLFRLFSTGDLVTSRDEYLQSTLSILIPTYDQDLKLYYIEGCKK